MAQDSIGEIARMLAARAFDLCMTLLPHGVREGHEWRIGSLAGEPGRSLAVRLSGDKAGVWCDFASGEAGDALDLVAQVSCGGDKAKALAWARQWLGLNGNNPSALTRTRRAIEHRVHHPGEHSEKNRSAAMRIWLAAQDQILDTPVDRYLLARGIDVRLLKRQPGALRFAPALWNRESERCWPAMIAAIRKPGGRIAAVHRTWLEVHPDGRVTKAPLRDPKMTLGSYAGGCIRLSHGSTSVRLSEAQPGETLIVSEGIEDGLTGAVVCPEYRAVAAVALANLANLELPNVFAKTIVLAQNDTNPRAVRALQRAIRKLQHKGHHVAIARPPAQFKDINDFLLAERANGTMA